MIELDGSYLEGGGQIIRSALALSALTKKPFKITNIRKGRCTSGLAHQHLESVKAVALLCDAKVKGASLGSEEITFIPNKIKAKNMDIDIGTAGSITLLLQALLLPCLFADKKVKIKLKGGTDVRWSQPLDYFSNVLVPQLRRFCEINVQLINRGYYPKGNGIVKISVNPSFKINEYPNFDDFVKVLQENMPIIDLVDQGKLIHIKGISHSSNDLQNVRVAERQAESAALLLKKYNCPVNIREEYSETISTGSGIALWAIFSKEEDEIDIRNPIRMGADCLGEKGKKAENVGMEAAQELIKQIDSKAPIDKYLGDQILPFLALVKGKIKISEITNHCKTNIYVIEQFLGKKFEIKDNIIQVK